MIKRKRSYAALVAALLIVIALFMQPLVFKKRTVEEVTGIDLPETAKFIEYKVDLNPLTSFRASWGVNRIYAKIMIDSYTFEAWTIDRTDNRMELLDYVTVFKEEYQSLNVEEIEEIWLRDTVGGRLDFFSGTTGVAYTVITKESDALHYLYVIY